MHHASESSLELTAISPQIGVDLSESRSSYDRLTPDARTTHSKKTSARGFASLKRKTNKREFDFGGSWLWEIGCAAVAVIGITLLVAFFIKIHGTPYADWQYTASPNTVVSIIMTITEAALLVPITSCLGQLKWNLYRRPTPLRYMQTIDEASQGSLGSLQILGQGMLGSKMGVLTFCGAFLTILALAVDPFAQQILNFPVRPTQASNETASIPCVQNYTSGVGGSANGYDDEAGLTPSLAQAILSGVLISNSSIRPECSSGSCSYPEFVSLGVCGQCKNVTEQMTQDCQEEDPDCNYTSPSGFNVTINLDDLDLNGQTEQNMSIFNVNYWLATSRTTGITFDIYYPIVSFITASQNGTIVWTSTTTPPKPTFTECVMYWCEKKYATSNYSGSTTETPILQTQQLSWDPDGQLAPVPGIGTLSNVSSYYVTSEILSGLSSILAGVFNGKTSNYDSSEITSNLTIADFIQMNSMAEIVDSVSTQLTDTMRAADSDQSIPGIAYRDVTFIQVRWPWIILPLSVVLGSTVLLLATTMATRKGNTVLWKNSVIPLLMTDLDIAPEYNLNLLRNVDEVTKISEKITVVLEEDDGLRLLEV